MKHIAKSSVAALVLFCATLPAHAHVSGSDPRPQVVVAQPQPSVWSVILNYIGISVS